MELLFEIIIELLFEGGAEICSNRKISKWIRYPILFIFMLFFGTVIFGIIFLGVYLLKINIFVGLFFIVIGLAMLISGIRKFKKYYNEKFDKN